MTATNGRSHDHGLVYAEVDLGEVDAAQFGQRTAPDGTGVVVTGTCPRCHGRTESPFPWGMPGTGTKGAVSRLLGGLAPGREAGEPDPLSEETHYCECGHAHPGCPPDTSYRGCGAGWRILP
ncbi:hypothetical protein [Streptomyces sp. NPDC059761]|uniref:hypothetical protein n=1 Tax=Streptomyces sp. NPDC059761 TaxID=3346937 RepID=UPI00365C46BC